MRKIMEPSFYFIYLIAIITFGIIMIAKSKKRLHLITFGIACIILGLGDAFHLIPRAVGIFTGSLEAPSATLNAYLGIGKLVTSITMTLFYILLYVTIYKRRKRARSTFLDIIMGVLLVARIVLLALPQNEWAINGGNVTIGIIRNIPFVIMGGIMVYLTFKYMSDKPYGILWLLIVLSFLFYIPVVIWAGTNSLVGMLMLPKTICYLIIGILGLIDIKTKN